jgi:predicted esterase
MHAPTRTGIGLAALVAAIAVVGATAGEAPAGDGLRLQEIAERYADTGDLAQAKAALKKARATAKALQGALRGARPHVAAAFGSSKIPLEDGHGRKTDLYTQTPGERDADAAASAGGCTTVLALHGRTLDGSSILDLGRHLGPAGRTIVLAPTAQKLPAGFEPDDLSRTFMASVSHWWMETSARSFPLEALRLAKRRYPIDTDRVLLFGYSMGGHGTWNIGVRFPDRFAGIAPCAGVLSEREAAGDDAAARKLLPNARALQPWFTHGEKDEIEPVVNSRKIDAALTELGITHTYEEIPGGSHFLPLLFGTGNRPSLERWAAARKRDPAPAKVDFVSGGEYADGAFWLRIAKRSGPGAATIRGTADRKENLVQVSAEGPVAELCVYLDDRLLDLSKKVTLEVPGQEPVIVAKPELDLETVLESWRTREDPKLVYGVRVIVPLAPAH